MPRPVSNPPNPWLSTHVEYLGEPPDVELTVYEEEATSILAENDSPDIPFRWSVNPYRGCYHACAYCYARPTHQYLGFGAGTDFDRRIVVKTNADGLLDDALTRPRWRRELIAFSGVTDCYQPLEASYGLTRGCLRVCLRRDNPVAIVTKGALVERDADLLARLARGPGARVFASVPFIDDVLARAIEPTAATPERRLLAVRRLSEAGVPTGVAIAPVIPGLNDDQIPSILAAARDAGASEAFMIALRLPGEVAQVFEERLRGAAPLRADKVMNAVREMRDGALNSTAFGQRMRGHGPRWRAIEAMFGMQCRRLGLGTKQSSAPRTPTGRARQKRLFE